MKANLFSITVFLAALTCKLYGQMPKTTTMSLDGFYTGKNLLVKNSFATGQGFCIIQVKTNGYISPAEINSDIFEIPLNSKSSGLKLGDSVKIEIRYKLDCSPKVRPSILNPGALLSFQNKNNPKENHLILDGEFNWGALLVINPYNSSNKSYCIKGVKINGKPFDLDLNNEIISLDLNKLGQPTSFNSEAEEKAAKAKGGLKEGDKIQIEFVYEKGSDPTILNADIITPWTTKQ